MKAFVKRKIKEYDDIGSNEIEGLTWSEHQRAIWRLQERLLDCLLVKIGV
jgi:hypothetical protein